MIHLEILKSLGCLPDLTDDRDYILKDIIMGAPSIPKTFSLKKEQSEVKEQGARGTCTAFATTALVEFFNYQEDLSEEYLFKRIKEIDVKDYGHTGYGAYLRSACKAITQYGTCHEDDAPYDKKASEDSWQDFKITEEMEDMAGFFRTESYASIGNREIGVKLGMITSNAPVLSGIMLYENYKQARGTGFLPLPSGKEIGGHALLIVGYTDSHWIAKNSWGKDWGDDGYLLIPFKYPLFSSWSFVDVDNKYLKDDIKKEILIRKCSEYAKASFKKALDKGVMTVDSEPFAELTKQDFAVFLDRLGLLDK